MAIFANIYSGVPESFIQKLRSIKGIAKLALSLLSIKYIPVFISKGTVRHQHIAPLGKVEHIGIKFTTEATEKDSA